jgi:hypothetical protein
MSPHPGPVARAIVVATHDPALMAGADDRLDPERRPGASAG